MAENAIPATSDYEEKLDRLLTVAAEVFAKKGYHNASIRDIARHAEVSLSGLYYYFRSKEELLYKVQSRCFQTVLADLEQRLEGEEAADERLRILVHNHVRFFARNMAAMRVLSHEYDALEGPYREKIRDLRRRYTDICTEILRELRRSMGGADVVPLGVVTFALFGMMNWIYTWYRPDRNVPVDRLAEHLYMLFVGGFVGRANGSAKRSRSASRRSEARTSR